MLFFFLFEMSFGLGFLEDFQLNGRFRSWSLGFEWFGISNLPMEEKTNQSARNKVKQRT